MLTPKLDEFKSDHFLLKATEIGIGHSAIVLGSHQYYPRTFSDNLTKKLHLICTDTRAFTLANPNDTEADFTLDNIIKDIEVVRASLGVEKTILIGHSIHAFMALEYASRFPDKVSHLVLIASSPIAGPDVYKEADRYFEESVCPARKTTLATNLRKFFESSNHTFIERMLAFGPRIWYDYHFDASKLWRNVDVNPLGAEIIWGSMFVNYPIALRLEAIKCPIFLALGRYDYFNPPYLWEAYRHYASNLTVRIFEKSSHTPQLEESEHFDTELIRWLGI